DTYERTGQMCDIFAIDPYPASLEASIGGSLERATQKAINAVYNERPVWTLGLAANWSGSYGAPVNSAMLRYQLYDALWAGAKGSGHYLSNSDVYADPTFTETYLATFKQAEASGEIDEIFDHFAFGNSEIFGEGTGNGYQWRSWYKETGDIYLAVRSKLGKDENNNDAVISTLTTDISLVSSDGNSSIDGFDATLVNGVSEVAVTSLTNNFTCTLAAGEVSLYKITPKTGYTLSNLETSSTATSVTVEYDVAKHNAEEGGTVIYSFYDTQGRFVKMEKEPANFSSEHISRTFDKVDFASMKIFIWDALGGLIPYSNVIE
ncbi:MAG: hypothetical protein IKB55_01045, partial [Clostridia bacterium]|nr:hypothetical protein [Clostridia bacterium]